MLAATSNWRRTALFLSRYRSFPFTDRGGPKSAHDLGPCAGTRTNLPAIWLATTYYRGARDPLSAVDASATYVWSQTNPILLRSPRIRGERFCHENAHVPYRRFGCSIRHCTLRARLLANLYRSLRVAPAGRRKCRPLRYDVWPRTIGLATCQDAFGARGEAFVATITVTDDAPFTQIGSTGGAGYTLAVYTSFQSPTDAATSHALVRATRPRTCSITTSAPAPTI